jgi:hypothetical protein
MVVHSPAFCAIQRRVGVTHQRLWRVRLILGGIERRTPIEAGAAHDLSLLPDDAGSPFVVAQAFAAVPHIAGPPEDPFGHRAEVFQPN